MSYPAGYRPPDEYDSYGAPLAPAPTAPPPVTDPAYGPPPDQGQQAQYAGAGAPPPPAPVPAPAPDPGYVDYTAGAGGESGGNYGFTADTAAPVAPAPDSASYGSAGHDTSAYGPAPSPMPTYGAAGHDANAYGPAPTPSPYGPPPAQGGDQQQSLGGMFSAAQDHAVGMKEAAAQAAKPYRPTRFDIELAGRQALGLVPGGSVGQPGTQQVGPQPPVGGPVPHAVHHPANPLVAPGTPPPPTTTFRYPTAGPGYDALPTGYGQPVAGTFQRSQGYRNAQDALMSANPQADYLAPRPQVPPLTSLFPQYADGGGTTFQDLAGAPSAFGAHMPWNRPRPTGPIKTDAGFVVGPIGEPGAMPEDAAMLDAAANARVGINIRPNGVATPAERAAAIQQNVRPAPLGESMPAPFAPEPITRPVEAMPQQPQLFAPRESAPANGRLPEPPGAAQPVLDTDIANQIKSGKWTRDQAQLAQLDRNAAVADGAPPPTIKELDTIDAEFQKAATNTGKKATGPQIIMPAEAGAPKPIVSPLRQAASAPLGTAKSVGAGVGNAAAKGLGAGVAVGVPWLINAKLADTRGRGLGNTPAAMQGIEPLLQGAGIYPDANGSRWPGVVNVAERRVGDVVGGAGALANAIGGRAIPDTVTTAQDIAGPVAGVTVQNVGRGGFQAGLGLFGHSWGNRGSLADLAGVPPQEIAAQQAAAEAPSYQPAPAGGLPGQAGGFFSSHVPRFGGLSLPGVGAPNLSLPGTPGVALPSGLTPSLPASVQPLLNAGSSEMTRRWDAAGHDAAKMLAETGLDLFTAKNDATLGAVQWAAGQLATRPDLPPDMRTAFSGLADTAGTARKTLQGYNAKAQDMLGIVPRPGVSAPSVGAPTLDFAGGAKQGASDLVQHPDQALAGFKAGAGQKATDAAAALQHAAASIPPLPLDRMAYPGQQVGPNPNPGGVNANVLGMEEIRQTHDAWMSRGMFNNDGSPTPAFLAWASDAKQGLVDPATGTWTSKAAQIGMIPARWVGTPPGVTDLLPPGERDAAAKQFSAAHGSLPDPNASAAALAPVSPQEVAHVEGGGSRPPYVPPYKQPFIPYTHPFVPYTHPSSSGGSSSFHPSSSSYHPSSSSFHPSSSSSHPSSGFPHTFPSSSKTRRGKRGGVTVGSGFPARTPMDLSHLGSQIASGVAGPLSHLGTDISSKFAAKKPPATPAKKGK